MPDDTVLGGLLLSYARRKKWEAKLVANELARVLMGDGEPDRVSPDEMLGLMGVKL